MNYLQNRNRLTYIEDKFMFIKGGVAEREIRGLGLTDKIYYIENKLRFTVLLFSH